jgi:GntR family transcriptional regulator / MocR family aminotransferase
MDWIKLDHSKQKEKPLFWQLTDQLRESIQRGRLVANYRLPSSRTLSIELKVSRNIVILAYEQLAIEGYLQARAGSGNYVSDGAVWTNQEIRASKQPLLATVEAMNSGVSQQSRLIDFRPGVPAIDLFPYRLWARILRDVCLSVKNSDLDYGEGSGCSHLRKILCEHLRVYRGLKCTSDQIVITSGAAQSFALLAPMFAAMCPELITEDPVSKAIPTHFRNAGLNIVPVPADEHGLDTELLPDTKKRRLVFVTPSHQFPLGGVLPIQRRIELIQFAQKSGSYIIEDDYDSEFRHHGSPLPPLRNMNTDQVIYVGTFSKMLFPGLRLGYAILPAHLVNDFIQRKRSHDLQCPIIDQLAVAQFIEAGHLRRHILQMKRVYARRRQVLITSLQKAFAGGVRILGDTTGLHLNAEFAHYQFNMDTVDKAQQNGIGIHRVEEYAINSGRHKNKLIFGYGNLSPQRIEKGVKILAAVLLS